MSDLWPGDRLGGYVVDRVLGRGGMGTVYVATQVDLGREVALKVLAPELAFDPGLLERFRQEAFAAARIPHPHVVTVFDAGIVDGMPFISMQLVDGPDLDRLLDGARMEPERALRILGGIADALDHLHARGLVHRDVKPANVLVSAGDHALLTDFGITRMTGAERLTATGLGIGTGAYAAPEQHAGELVDGRADVYALAVTLEECVGPGSVLAPVIARATARDPQARHPSAGELIRAAEKALAASRRRPRRRSALALAVATLAGAGAGAGWAVAPASEPAVPARAVPAPGAAYAQDAQRVLQALGKRPDIRARRPAARASAARAAAATHHRAARDLDRLAVPAGGHARHVATVRALRRLGAGFERLAVAARKRDRSGDRAALRALARDDAALRRAVSALRRALAG